MSKLSGPMDGDKYEFLNFVFQKVTSLPSWVSADEGRGIFVTTAGASYGFWIGNSSTWVRPSGPTGPVDNVADLAALKAIVAANRNAWMRVMVQGQVAVYTFDDTNTTSESSPEILIPDDVTHPAPGRWLRVAWDDTDEINVISNAAFTPLGLGGSFTLQQLLVGAWETYRARKWTLSPLTIAGVTGTSTTGMDTTLKLISGHNDGGGDATAGGIVVNSTIAHVVPIRQGSDHAKLIDPVTGNTVYGRLTWSGSNYVLSFYKKDASGSETTHNIGSSTDIHVPYVWFSELELNRNDWFRDGVFDPDTFYSHIRGHASDIKIDSQASARMLPTSTTDDVMAALLALEQQAVDLTSGSTTDNAIPRFDGDASGPPVGPRVQDSSVLIDDSNNLDQSASTGWLRTAVGTTLERPGTPLGGMVRYNTNSNRHEVAEDDPNDAGNIAWFDVCAAWGYDDLTVIHIGEGGNDTTGTGSIHQPFATLQAAVTAVTAASVTNTVVFRVHGTVAASSTGLGVNMSGLASNTHIIGDGPRASAIVASSSAAYCVLWAADLENCGIQNISLFNTATEPTAYVLQFGASGDSDTLTNCHFENVHCWGYGGATTLEGSDPENVDNALVIITIDVDTPWSDSVVDNIHFGWLDELVGSWLDTEDDYWYNGLLVATYNGLSNVDATPDQFVIGKIVGENIGHVRSVDYSNLYLNALYTGLVLYPQSSSTPVVVREYCVSTGFYQGNTVWGAYIGSGAVLQKSNVTIRCPSANASPAYTGPTVLRGIHYATETLEHQEHNVNLTAFGSTTFPTTHGVYVVNSLTRTNFNCNVLLNLTSALEGGATGSNEVVGVYFAEPATDADAPIRSGVVHSVVNLIANSSDDTIDYSSGQLNAIQYSGDGPIQLYGHIHLDGFSTDDVEYIYCIHVAATSVTNQGVGHVLAQISGDGCSSNSAIMRIHHNATGETHYFCIGSAVLLGPDDEAVGYAILRTGVSDTLNVVRATDGTNASTVSYARVDAPSSGLGLVFTDASSGGATGGML